MEPASDIPAGCDRKIARIGCKPRGNDTSARLPGCITMSSRGPHCLRQAAKRLPDPSRLRIVCRSRQRRHAARPS